MTSSGLKGWMKDFDWVANDDIPWATLQQSVNQARMTIVSTGGLYTPEQEPFAIEDGDDVDESYRVIPAAIDVSTLGIAHEHYDHQFAEEDRNVVFPLDRFRELAEDGEVGELAPRAFSITGYIPAPNKLFETADEIANLMLEDGVDAAFLTPV